MSILWSSAVDIQDSERSLPRQKMETLENKTLHLAVRIEIGLIALLMIC